jgi:hypothetical protein
MASQKILQIINPAKAGSQVLYYWIPTFVGMTKKLYLNPTRTSRNQEPDIQTMLKIPQLVRVQGVFFNKLYPFCVEFYSLVTKPYSIFFIKILSCHYI